MKRARSAKAFVPVNCGAIPENLMESEFFGYKKGAFTGADQERDGFFQAANGGTLFLR
jgi:two-component system response regulator PilR (NtrC family)